MSAHQALDAATAALPALRPQGGMHPGRPVAPLMARLETAHIAEQRQVSFDGNYRAKFWEARSGVAVPALHELVACADIFLGNYRDINLLLGTGFTGQNESDRRAASKAAFDAFPQLRLIASTLRTTHHSNLYGIAVPVDDPAQGYETDVINIPSVVDRIGTGDAFAADILHAERLGTSLNHIALDGRALCALKHTVRGDVGNLTLQHIQRFAAVERDVAR